MDFRLFFKIRDHIMLFNIRNFIINYREFNNSALTCIGTRAFSSEKERDLVNFYLKNGDASAQQKQNNLVESSLNTAVELQKKQDSAIVEQNSLNLNKINNYLSTLVLFLLLFFLFFKIINLVLDVFIPEVDPSLLSTETKQSDYILYRLTGAVVSAVLSLQGAIVAALPEGFALITKAKAGLTKVLTYLKLNKIAVGFATLAIQNPPVMMFTLGAVSSVSVVLLIKHFCRRVWNYMCDSTLSVVNWWVGLFTANLFRFISFVDWILSLLPYKGDAHFKNITHDRCFTVWLHKKGFFAYLEGKAVETPKHVEKIIGEYDMYDVMKKNFEVKRHACGY